MKKKIIKLTENHILKIVKAVLNEQANPDSPDVQSNPNLSYDNDRIKNIAYQIIQSGNRNATNYDSLGLGNKINNPNSKRYNGQPLNYYFKDNNVRKDEVEAAIEKVKSINYNDRIKNIANQLIFSNNSNANTVKDIKKDNKINNPNSSYNGWLFSSYLQDVKSKFGEITDNELQKAIDYIKNNNLVQKNTSQQKTTWRMNNNFPLKFSDKGDKIAQMQKVLGVKPTGQFWIKTEEKIKNANVGYTRNTGVTEDMYKKIMNINSFTNNQESNNQNYDSTLENIYNNSSNQQTNPEPQKMKSKSFSQNTPNIKQPQIK